MPPSMVRAVIPTSTERTRTTWTATIPRRGTRRDGLESGDMGQASRDPRAGRPEGGGSIGLGRPRRARQAYRPRGESRERIDLPRVADRHGDVIGPIDA